MAEFSEPTGTEESDCEAADWPEVRLALVLYGGVSLAIYMYGVAHEIWRAVLASKALERCDPDTENPWTAVLETVKRRVTVDVISGASAGGINGILLGRAFASGGDLEVARDVWLDQADLKELLATAASEPSSLLDSDRFSAELDKALKSMGTDPQNAVADVLDVFVSTTHLHGDVRAVTDSLNHKLVTKRHDIPVRLRYRNPDRYAEVIATRGSENPGDPFHNDFDNTALLVQLGRATSAFPFAFEPIHREEGQFANGDWPAGDYTDGGVTDNKPFEQVLETIFGRAAAQPVKRWVLSVNPDPEGPPPSSASAPDFLDVVASATFAIPRYESVQRDLDRLQDHMLKVQIFWDGALGGMENAIAEERLSGIPDPQYAGLRRAALVNFLADEYRRSRRDSAVIDERSTPFEDAMLISGLLPGEERDWMAHDVAYELRRAYYVIKLLGRQLGDDALTEPDHLLVEARKELWGQFERARKAGRAAVDELLASGGRALNLKRPNDAGGALGPNLEGLSRLSRAADAFTRFDERDRALLAVDPFGYQVQRDEVNFAQIDPSAAQHLESIVPSADRLAGDVLGHFGGFLDRRWRENDILWGRLDCADVLVGALASGSGGTRTELTEEVQKAITTEALSTTSADWHAALAAHAAGREGLSDLPAGPIAELTLRAGRTVQRMFRSLSLEGRKTRTKLFRLALRPLGSGLFRLLTPVAACIVFVRGNLRAAGRWLKRLRS